MEYQEILDHLAPCGLNCRKCMASCSGDIKYHCTELKQLLGDQFERYAERFSQFLPVFKQYPAFKELLNFFAGGNCTGCRNGACRYPNCGVLACTKDKGVDFCFQCSDFPCEKSNLDQDLKKRWIDMNSRMRSIGVEAYYEETKDQCRYA